MYKEIWNKYKRGFKFLLPFILVQIIFQSFNFNLQFTNYDFIGEGGSLLENFSIFNEAISNNIVKISFELFVGTLFFSILMVSIKTLLNKGTVNYGESFKEGISLYPRYLLINVVLFLISSVLIFLGFWSIFIPFMVILMIYFNIILTPCKAYLVYYNTSAGDALKKGMVMGKKYSGEIILLGLGVGIVFIVIGGIMSAFNINPETNLIIYSVTSFINVNIQIYFAMFVMNICKREEKVQKEILGY